MRCGYIGIIGRPNVGKSTLLNRIVGMKVSITSSKPQTTREQILGIHTTSDTQYIFIDTPGLHQSEQKYSNRLMNRAAKGVFEDADVLLWVLDSQRFTEDDEAILEKLSNSDKPIIVALNKKDRVEEKELFTLTKRLVKILPNAQFVPCSAKTGHHTDKLLKLIANFLPKQDFVFDKDLVTDKSEKFYAAEIIREKIMRLTGKELPYACAVEIDKYADERSVLHIHATIWVDKENHKPMLLGSGGERLKQIGQDARIALEKFWDQKVYLKLWVKVKKPGFVSPNY